MHFQMYFSIFQMICLVGNKCFRFDLNLFIKMEIYDDTLIIMIYIFK